LKNFLPAISWLIITTILLTLPGSSFPKEDWLDKIWFDKWVHIGLFILMMVSWNWAIYKNTNKGKGLKTIFWIMGSIWLAYGIGMEFIQHYFIPNRSFDGGDIIADAAGCGIGLAYSFRRYIKK
jgi:VanZ family protein